MPPVTKPCPRAGKIGCLGTITERDAHRLGIRKSCSLACAFRSKQERGCAPQSYLRTGSDADKRRYAGVLKAGQIASANRHRRSLERAVRECADLVPASFEREFTSKAMALFKVLLARAFERGRSLEVRRQDNRRRRSERKAEAA